MELAYNSTDRDVWRFAQDNQMLLLTDNRNMVGADSLEQTIRDENQVTSLPVITLSRADRVIEQSYRERCATRLLDIILGLDNYLGTGEFLSHSAASAPCFWRAGRTLLDMTCPNVMRFDLALEPQSSQRTHVWHISCTFLLCPLLERDK